MPVSALRAFIKMEASGGILLLAAAVIALVLVNSPLGWLYDGVLETPVQASIGSLVIAKPLLLWINDGLMAIFFLLIGLEIKREVLDGNLSKWAEASLPAIGAVGGMAIPALVYVAFNAGDPVTLNGWAIPAATDIAFALGILALVGTRAPTSLKVFLLALAIIDDLGAIVIIAVFYTANLSLLSLGLAAIAIVGLVLLNRLGVTRITPYMLIGVFLWVCVLKSGVHATLAGVAIAFAIPLRATHKGRDTSPLEQLEHNLHPWVTYAIMPVFAFANAGVSLAGLSIADLFAPVPLGIAAGLFLGKQIGVFGFSFAAVKLGVSRLPGDITWLQFYGVALLTGVGFTMSLFIGTLAFADPAYQADVRIGVLTGSFLSAISGFLLLRFAPVRGR
ncbi:MAG: Na+/H+ antiporter NhaA [Alphaproteobacteria bacterium]|nr:Na+/H+ antiporter NhaA [Alphaproteobacteria bacterium]MBU0798357.1 Na+/H+ antiporter NhaA [Alphaproteobacteria bacterium]MBU0887458.1 Na+/H+ antiporter NhaA [Alphaproteobacteria bacterium]MBU1813333.1 Na+/H+ antiporter NhaA [Alphaproteobacteria bacterium]